MMDMVNLDLIIKVDVIEKRLEDLIEFKIWLSDIKMAIRPDTAKLYQVRQS